MNLQQLAATVQRSESTIKTNFPKFVKAMAKKGIFIERDSRFLDKANFTITYGEPKEINSQEISIRKYQTNKLDGEIWIKSYLGQDLEVSSLGRYRWVKQPNNFYRGTSRGKQGYLKITYENKSYAVHRVILQSFKPIPDFEFFTVDHLNGKRDDNRLENLEWVTNEENTFRMLIKRKDLNKELTRLIQKYTYEGTMERLKAL